jgi:folate-binding protein YgfZ
MNGYQALHSGVAYIDYSDRGKIAVTGDDRARLLHAMSSNDVAGLAQLQGVYALFLNAQGRILADALIYNLGDRLLLDTEPELREKLQDHLDKYIIADDVYLEDVTAGWAAIGLEGPESFSRTAELGWPVPAETLAIAEFGGGFIVRTSATGPTGVRLFVPAQEKPLWIARLKDLDIPEASAGECRTVRIENGVPRYGEEISERFLVQEAGVMHGVHTTKGCYLGQEIVERVRSRAQVHRHLSRVRISGATVPPAGTKLQANGKDAAEIVSGAYSPTSGAVIAFAYVRTEALADRPEMQVPDSSAVATLL